METPNYRAARLYVKETCKKVDSRFESCRPPCCSPNVEAPHLRSGPERHLRTRTVTMGGVDEDGLISGLREEQLITNEEMDQIVKEVGAPALELGQKPKTPFPNPDS